MKLCNVQPCQLAVLAVTEMYVSQSLPFCVDDLFTLMPTEKNNDKHFLRFKGFCQRTNVYAKSRPNLLLQQSVCSFNPIRMIERFHPMLCHDRQGILNAKGWPLSFEG